MQARSKQLMFLAPHDFDPSVFDEYAARFIIFPGPLTEIIVADPSAPYRIDDAFLEPYKRIEIVATPSTGTNHIDLEACQRRGIKVISLLDDREGLETISASAEFTFKLILDALRIPPAHELQEKRVGLIGYGRIGRRLADWCSEFGAFIMACDPCLDVGSTIEAIFKKCDIVVICCTLNDETHGMVTGDLLRSMKKGAALINTARGEIIDEDALAEVMKERPDLRVAVDVLVGMTSGTHNPKRLQDLGAIVTNHIAGATYESRTKAARIILRLLEREINE